MAAPTRVKTWTKDRVVAVTGDGPSWQPGAAQEDSDNRNLIFKIKEALIGVNGNWTVVSSCGYNAAAWSYGAADYWQNADDVRFLEDPGAHLTWIVLQNNAIKTGFQIMIVLDYADSSTENWDSGFYTSHSGSFTGGTDTARPTASDEYRVHDISVLFTGAGERAANILMSTDGECTRIFWCYDGAWKATWLIEKPKAGTGLGTDHFEGVGLTATFSASRTLTYTMDDNPYRLVAAGGVQARWTAATDGVGMMACANAPLMQGVDYSGNRVATPLYAILQSGGSRGVLGELVDVYNVDEDLNDTDYAPAGGAMEWVVINDFLFANDGTPFIL